MHKITNALGYVGGFLACALMMALVGVGFGWLTHTGTFERPTHEPTVTKYATLCASTLAPHEVRDPFVVYLDC